MVIHLSPSATKQFVRLSQITPTTQKLLIGATGLISHTTIDALNPYVSKETRKYSAVRSAVKMFIGTLSGIITRQLGQNLGKWAVNAGKVKVPAGITKLEYASCVGKVFAIAGAISSIFIIDIPFINKALNLIMEKFFNTKTPSKYSGKGRPRKHII